MICILEDIMLMKQKISIYFCNPPEYRDSPSGSIMYWWSIWDIGKKTVPFSDEEYGWYVGEHESFCAFLSLLSDRTMADTFTVLIPTVQYFCKIKFLEPFLNFFASGSNNSMIIYNLLYINITV